MNVEVRPATKAEQMYCYTQSDQIMGQTGCIGHLRADMGDSGEQFLSQLDQPLREAVDTGV